MFIGFKKDLLIFCKENCFTTLKPKSRSSVKLRLCNFGSEKQACKRDGILRVPPVSGQQNFFSGRDWDFWDSRIGKKRDHPIFFLLLKITIILIVSTNIYLNYTI